ncbi:hypothetical protein [Enterovirga rhinocerotis]|uniref:Uncharacterized protein n=1 Tax=Enterovirga rhinocerotis TaxID=1339210 RepID=A0A4R7BUU0_9HYPH|nr:hypothetical protein [Enterovirga rhinocerotis]TDR87957.1 hypothetical protein EV668_3821 [Enterovirga rhinocerotis]
MLACDGTSTRFAKALEQYGLDKCLINETTLWIGADGSRDWPNFRRVPPNPGPRRQVEFLAAPHQADLVAAFVASPEALVVEELLIGTSPEFPTAGFDMTAAVAALEAAHLPSLTTLDLGDMQNLYGGFRLFGTVGEIGHVFAAAPCLRHLGVFGHFALATPVRHDTLETLFTEFDDFGITGEPISQATLDHLVTSSFPRLSTLHLDMDEGGGDETLTLPEPFFSPGHLSRLERLDIDRLVPEAKARLDAYRRARRLMDPSLPSVPAPR